MNHPEVDDMLAAAYAAAQALRDVPDARISLGCS